MTIRTYAQLLKFGLTQLNDFVEDGSGGVTGIESSLTDTYLDDILEISHYLYTTASTNDPEDPLYQPMFLTFIAPKNRINQLLDELHRRSAGRYYYSIRNCANLKEHIARYPHGSKTPYLLNDRDIDNIITCELPPNGRGLNKELWACDIEDSLPRARNLYQVIREICNRLFRRTK
jgi:hypothetical protein